MRVVSLSAAGHVREADPAACTVDSARGFRLRVVDPGM